MASILEVYPAARRAMFRNFHIGGCSSCGFQPEETLEAVCRRNEDLDPLKAIEVIERAQEEESRLMLAPSEVKKRLDAGEAFVLVDIRSREEHEAVALPGSRSLTQEVTQELMDAGRPASTIVLYDHQGRHVMDAVSYFIGHGVKEVFGLEGGIDAWALQVDPGMPRYQLER